ncbi:ABC-2 type transport system permease protein [Clostridium cavendishii DSM 21758]|uniref:ABC-2 type transport system permease protein n=1 Tax=Clostridium cavendishii DSM 21758 TaxID=1121302 RepID=A0A1M6HZA9_9CLOT|nr:ABC transporter permease [Clostridium cavendishii]SHJ27568.1 ABC-2 type transport system permease protein [Clostridium cavendishii DSM 21758]
MINLLKLEFHKLKHNKSFLIIALITVIAEIINVIKNGTISGERAFQNSMYDIATLMLLGSVFAGLFIGTDFSNRIINKEVSAGHSRLKILLSKGILFFLATEMIMLVYPIASVTVNTILNGWGSSFDLSTVIYIIKTILFRMVLDASCISLWIFIAFLCKDVTKTMGVSILVFMMGSITLAGLSFQNNFVKTIYDFTAHSQARVIVNKSISYAQVTSVLISKLIIISILLSLSYIMFRRTELK